MRQVPDEDGACLFSYFIHVHIHRGDVWFSEIGKRISVKSHESHIFRDPNTLILQLMHHTEDYHAVCTEYGPGRLSTPRPRKNWPEGPTSSAGRNTRSVQCRSAIIYRSQDHLVCQLIVQEPPVAIMTIPVSNESIDDKHIPKMIRKLFRIDYRLLLYCFQHIIQFGSIAI